MVWFKVDDKFHDHRKARKVRRSHPSKRRDSAPFGLWVLAGSWCGANSGENGFVPLEVLEDWDDDAEALVQRLVDAGLWWKTEVDGEPGYGFHDWTDYIPKPDGVDDPSLSGKLGNHIRWHEKRGRRDPECPFCNRPDRGDIGGDDRGESENASGANREPGPTRPDPTAAASDHPTSTTPVDNVSIEILADKLRRHTILRSLRTDMLNPDWEARIVALIERHGDQRLVDAALAGLRRDDPPRTIQAFVAGWEAMPDPGKHIAAVPDPTCPQPGHTGTTRHCVQCASERKAAR